MLTWFNAPKPKYTRFLLLDRDGILNRNSPEYVKSFQEYHFFPDALEALRLLNAKGIEVILVSNQSGLHRGLISWADFWGMHEGMLHEIERIGGRILATFYCPHHPDERCGCRKPSPHMLLAACNHFGVKIQDTFFLGDHETDIQAARNAGCPGIRVCRENEEGDLINCRGKGLEPVFSSLLEAVLSLYGWTS